MSEQQNDDEPELTAAFLLETAVRRALVRNDPPMTAERWWEITHGNHGADGPVLELVKEVLRLKAKYEPPEEFSE